MDISDKQWDLLKDLLVIAPKRLDNRGRPRQEIRSVFNGILWILHTGAPWKEIPGRYPPYQTCHWYFQDWVNTGTWDKVLWMLAKDLKDRGKIDITECFIDGTFASAKKEALVLAKLREVKIPRTWQSQTLLVFLSPYGPPEQALMK
jgi:transposase